MNQYMELNGYISLEKVSVTVLKEKMIAAINYLECTEQKKEGMKI